MSVDQLSSRHSPRRSDDAKLVRYDEFIGAKIESTRRTVKLVDLATTLVALAAGVLAFLLAAAIAEHWVVPGGFSVAARTALFTLLLIGIGYFAYRRLWPLLVRAINPVYAARAIEQGSPSLKNSLINLLLFRQRRSDISDAVYRTLEEQAAQRLTRVPVETAVDRSLLIRLGYVLVAVVAIAGLYKVFSPKDPFVAAERVLLPWADIVPASRISISAVKPGSIIVSRGEFVDVSADVRGLGDDDEVLLRYTTDDGQVVAKPIPMKPAGDGLRFSCRVADEADGPQQIGLTRSLTYRLEAGDARSLAYNVTVVTAPSILVERVDYDYPAYTGYVDRSVERLGDIRAIEGTHVTVHARANGPIRQAHVDFDADGRPDLRMPSTGDEARTSFEVALREDRQTPQHASYVLRFTNAEGRTNHDPVKHSIIVERDRDPEAAILMPKDKAIDVRLDEKVAIEVEARDPDFALSGVRLRGEAAGRPAIDEPLLKGEHRGRFSARYSLVPSEHGLRAGDAVQYWVEVSDNRAPKPNTTASERKLIRIVSPNPAQQPPTNQVARNDRQQPQRGEPQNGRPQDQKGQGEAAGEKGNANQQQGGAASGQQQAGDKQRQEDKEKGSQGAGGESAGGETASADGKSDGKAGAGNSAKDSKDSDKNNQQSKSGGQGQAGQEAKSTQEKSDQQKSKDEQTSAGAAGGQSSKDTAQPAGPRSDHGESVQQANDKQQKGDQQTKPGNQQTPVSSEGDNDGEAFERIQQHLGRNGQLKEGDDVSRDAERSVDQRQGDKETRRQGENAEANKEAAKDKSDGEGKSADGTAGTKPGDNNQRQPADQQAKDRGDGPGAKTRGDDLPQKKEPTSDRHEQDKSPGGQQTASKGPAGASDEQKSQGAPNSQPEMKPTEKRQQSPSKDRSNQQEPPAGASGKRDSDSQGDQGGDKAGGGEEGGGQKAPREGTGSAGSHQSADEGTGESGEKGKGDTSPNAGHDAKSDHKTGSSSGETPGQGSKTQEGSGNKAGGQRGGENAAAPSEDKETRRQGDKENGKQSGQKVDDSGKSDNSMKQSTPDGASGGNGQPGAAVNPQPSIKGPTPEGDAANLEYARKQTDLVVEKLSDQLNRNKVDEHLLKELGWTQDDLRRFVERWRQRKDAAHRDDPSGEAAKRELDDALRSLGLRRGTLQQSAAKKDSLRDLREGYRGPVPLEYQERLRAYNQGVSRAHREGE